MQEAAHTLPVSEHCVYHLAGQDMQAYWLMVYIETFPSIGVLTTFLALFFHNKQEPNNSKKVMAFC